MGFRPTSPSRYLDPFRRLNSLIGYSHSPIGIGAAMGDQMFFLAGAVFVVILATTMARLGRERGGTH